MRRAAFGLWVLVCSCGRSPLTAAGPDPSRTEPAVSSSSVSASPGSPAPASSQGAAPTAPLPKAPPGLSASSPTGSSSAAPLALPEAAPSASSSAGSCAVAVQSVLEGHVYTGPGPDSPARQASMARLPPETARQWRARDHGVRHLSCTYTLVLNGNSYRYRYTAGQSFSSSRPLDPATCSLPGTQREVEEHVRDFTKQCADLHAGEYWGDRLVPL